MEFFHSNGIPVAMLIHRSQRLAQLIGWRHGNRWQRSNGRGRPYRWILRSSQRTPGFVLLDCRRILCGSRNRNPSLRLAADSSHRIRTIAPDLPGDTFSNTCPPSNEHVLHPDWSKRVGVPGSRALPVAHWWNGCARDRLFHVGRLRACARGVCRFVSIDERCLFDFRAHVRITRAPPTQTVDAV